MFMLMSLRAEPGLSIVKSSPPIPELQQKNCMAFNDVWRMYTFSIKSTYDIMFCSESEFIIPAFENRKDCSSSNK